MVRNVDKSIPFTNASKSDGLLVVPNAVCAHLQTTISINRLIPRRLAGNHSMILIISARSHYSKNANIKLAGNCCWLDQQCIANSQQYLQVISIQNIFAVGYWLITISIHIWLSFRLCRTADTFSWVQSFPSKRNNRLTVFGENVRKHRSLIHNNFRCLLASNNPLWAN